MQKRDAGNEKVEAQWAILELRYININYYYDY